MSVPGNRNTKMCEFDTTDKKVDRNSRKKFYNSNNINLSNLLCLCVWNV